jgi:hypothetical protein
MLVLDLLYLRTLPLEVIFYIYFVTQNEVLVKHNCYCVEFVNLISVIVPAFSSRHSLVVVFSGILMACLGLCWEIELLSIEKSPKELFRKSLIFKLFPKHSFELF